MEDSSGSNKNIVCYERWDYEMLESIRSLEGVRPQEVKKSLQDIKLHINDEGRVLVHYSTGRGDKKGRLYGSLALQDEEWLTTYWPMGLSLQRLAKWVRHFVSCKYYRDFDIVNAAPNLMEQILNRYNLCPPALTQFNKNRSAIFLRYSKLYNIPREEVKTVFLGIMHTGAADRRFIESGQIKQGLDNALRQLARRPEYSILYKSIAKQYNPLGTFSFAIWAREEHKVLMCMREFFIQLGYHPDHFVLCFDGIMLEKDEVLDQTPIDLEALSAHIKQETGYSLKVEEKSLLPTVEDHALLQSFSDK